MNKCLNALLCLCISGLVACGGSSGSDDDSPGTPSSSSSSSSSTSSSTSSSSVFGAPQNLSAAPGNASVTLEWGAVSSADSYHIYYATEANIQPDNIAAYDNGTWIEDVTPPYQITELTNGTTYYFVVTAVDGEMESDPSAEVSTTPSAVDVARQPTVYEVLVLELVNRARFDPEAEAERHAIDLNEDNNGTPISPARKPPLAFNLELIEAARVHSEWMLDADVFSHTGEGGSSPTQRMDEAGYTFSGAWSSGENIAWRGNSGDNIDLTLAAYEHHEGLFKSVGHRLNILSTDFREIGIGHKDGYFFADGTNWRASMLTENFARSGSGYFLTGVVYEDVDGDDLYSVNEGLSGITITVDGSSHAVFETGAYTVPLANGVYDITVSGDALGSPVNYTIEVDGANVKFDVIKVGSAVDIHTW
ncbi:MAG TPA: CAP domain-containing protein [Cellvibrio sp.]|nr:CAP domain-containing protein [Cellvibrio sp.]